MKNVISVTVLFCLALFCVGCTATVPMAAYDFASNEAYHGSVSMSFFDGTGTIDVTGDRSKTVGKGMAVYGYGGGANRGGTATIHVADGRIVKADWITTGMTSGTGSGKDQQGNPFTFVFGVSGDEQDQFIQKQRSLVISGWKANKDAAVASDAGRAYREWNMQVGIQSRLNAEKERDPARASDLAFKDCMVYESRLRAAMKDEGFDEKTINDLIEHDKTDWPEQLRLLMKRSGLIES